MGKNKKLPVPLVELMGDRRVLIEHHCGVSSYTGEEVTVRVAYGMIRIQGSGLCIARMCREQLVILGRIRSVALEKGEGHGGK